MDFSLWLPIGGPPVAPPPPAPLELMPGGPFGSWAGWKETSRLARTRRKSPVARAAASFESLGKDIEDPSRQRAGLAQQGTSDELRTGGNFVAILQGESLEQFDLFDEP